MPDPRRLAVLLLSLLLPGLAWAGYLTPDAVRVLADGPQDELVSVIVVMAEPTKTTLAASRPQEVGARLKALASRSQEPLLRELSGLRAAGDVRRAVSLPIINGLAVTATKGTVRRIASRSDVAYVCLDGMNHILPVASIRATGLRLASVPWSLVNIRAEEAWNTFGLRGEGVVVAGLDTGVSVEHPCLQANYRGGNNSFYDAINHLAQPYDDYGHGTATMGNLCGNAPADSFFGAAPGATFIAAKCFDSAGNSSDSQILEAAGWMLDPDRDPGTDDAPDVVNNSWGGSPRDPWFESAVGAWVAAGIYPVFAIGNDGPDPSSTNSPGDYLGIMGVGATDSNNVIASYSGRGPAVWDGTPYLKPNVVGPGHKVDIPLVAGGYGTAGGTSFACPHVAGAAALLIQQRGPLVASANGVAGITKDGLNALLESTAHDLGAPGPDNDYGYGIIDVYDALAAGPPTLTWVGTGAYVADGVAPDLGNPIRSARPSTFTFRVRYRDVNGTPPGSALCVIQSKAAGEGWNALRTLTMARRSGSIAAGAVYECTTELPDSTTKYRFVFVGGNGLAATGDPASYRQGPLLIGPPHLTWTGKPGFETDGVDPDAAGVGTVFRLQVLYSDSAGDAPTTAQLLISRDGGLYRQKDMTASPAGDYRLGKLYRTSAPLNHPGAYEYRFLFADASGEADGDPAEWQTGPTIAPTPPAAITSLAALPTQAGAQLTFNLAGAADVTVALVNVAGRPIRTLIADKPLKAGVQTLVWNRRADNGLPVPAGLYVVRVTARDAGGGSSTALATLSLR